MGMIVLGIFMIVLGLYDYKNPDSKLLKFLRRAPKNDTEVQQVRSNGSTEMFGGIIFILIGVVVLLLRKYGHL
ncbi:hypothetical protein [Paenibacillus cineris]|uniref:hypothetical protein n=1 Tax=Paenibacillus cineris TaxID=237530 RepID=UPI001B1F499B|nr:hypothetical protein [Paenibacillus cineris]GIO59591.1 hypothetical protein J43TS9_11650 [Paenibacillus cineris]